MSWYLGTTEGKTGNKKGNETEGEGANKVLQGDALEVLEGNNLTTPDLFQYVTLRRHSSY